MLLIFTIGGFPNKPALKFFQSAKNIDNKIKEIAPISNGLMFFFMFLLNGKGKGNYNNITIISFFIKI
jgi:hypothetical protein